MDVHQVGEWKGTPKHKKAMSVHRALAVFYGVIAAITVTAAMLSNPRPGEVVLALLFALPAVIHGLIAFGAARANPVAQVFSILAAVLMLLGVPIGTILGIYLLRNSSWEEREAPAPT